MMIPAYPHPESVIRMKDRVIFGGTADWNLRRLLRVDGTLPMGVNPAAYLDWVPEGRELENGHLPRGAHGYLDAHPLAGERYTAVAGYLDDRLSGILRLVPGARETHLRLAAFERMLDDGIADAADLFHREGLTLDVWTANEPRQHAPVTMWKGCYRLRRWRHSRAMKMPTIRPKIVCP